MSNQQLSKTEVAEGLLSFLTRVEDDFTQIRSTDLSFKRECEFAKQQIMKNDYNIGIARNNPASLQNAIKNVAAVGLSLNPANAHAYLVPRDRSICLDISSRGLCRLATDTGVIKWVQAELVYKNDTYRSKGMARMPEHEYDAFGDRGEFRGVYCVAKTIDGDFLVEEMSAADVNKIRDTSQGYKSKPASSPWTTWFDQMAIKAVIKRASKRWPESQGSDRLNKAVNMLNDMDGNEPLETEYKPRYNDEMKSLFDSSIAPPDSEQLPDPSMLWHLSRSLEKEVWNDLHSSYLATAPKGEKTKYRKYIDEATNKGRDLFCEGFMQIKAAKESEDTTGAIEVLMDFEHQIETLKEQCDDEVSEWIDELRELM